MKIFQNPYVVGGLAILAVALIFRNAIAPLWRRMAPRGGAVQIVIQHAVQPAVSNVPTNVPVAETPVPKAPRLEPERNIDLTQVGWKWHSSPHRDPFQITPATITNLARLYPPASDLLSLTAVWRQTGSSLALINGRILGQGDSIMAKYQGKAGGETNATYKYKVETIDGDGVWVDGPAGREQVEFRSSGALNGSPTGKVGAKTDGTAMR